MVGFLYEHALRLQLYGVCGVDVLSVFLPVVEYSCVNLTSLCRTLIIARIHVDFVPTVGTGICHGNYPILSRARHFSTLTPFTNNHRQKDDSPINTGIKIPGMIALANAGAKKDEKQTTR